MIIEYVKPIITTTKVLISTKFYNPSGQPDV